MLSTDQKGAIAETAIMQAALRANLGVYRPAFEGGRYDLIFEASNRLLRVQCKWASHNGDVVVVRSYSCRRAREGMRSRRYTRDEVDGVAAYCAEIDRCYYLPIDFVDGRRRIHLRLGSAKNGQRAAINWASAFEFATVDWTAAGAVAQLEERSAGSRKVRGSNPLSSTTPAGGTPRVVGSHAFRNHFGEYMEEASNGGTFVIARHGKPLAQLGPVDQALPESEHAQARRPAA